jgi:hypothetical protein
MQHTEKKTETGYSLLKVKSATRDRFDKLLHELGTSLTDDDLLARLLDEHDQRESPTTNHQPA